MTPERFDEFFEETYRREALVLRSKAHQYASSQDRLENFKDAAMLLRTTPERVLFGYVTKHLMRLTDLILSGETVGKETSNEVIGDIRNYMLLLQALYYERNENENERNPNGP